MTSSHSEYKCNPLQSRYGHIRWPRVISTKRSFEVIWGKAAGADLPDPGNSWICDNDSQRWLHDLWGVCHTHNCSCKKPNSSNTISPDWTYVPNCMATSHDLHWRWHHGQGPWQALLVLRSIWGSNKEYQGSWGETLLWKRPLPQGRNKTVRAWNRA